MKCSREKIAQIKANFFPPKDFKAVIIHKEPPESYSFVFVVRMKNSIPIFPTKAWEKQKTLRFFTVLFMSCGMRNKNTKINIHIFLNNFWTFGYLRVSILQKPHYNIVYIPVY